MPPDIQPPRPPTPDVGIDRRTLLAAPAIAAAAYLPGTYPSIDAAEEPIDFQTFVDLCTKHAVEHLDRGRTDPDVLLHRIAALGARAKNSKVPEMKLDPFGDLDPLVEFGDVIDREPMLFTIWRLAPHAVLPAHPHGPSYVYSLCLDGECRVRHFEIADDAPPHGEPGQFQIRETIDKILRPGLGSSLTSDRDNIHAFVAGPRGAVGVDVNVVLPEFELISQLEHEESDAPDYHRLFDAVWAR